MRELWIRARLAVLYGLIYAITRCRLFGHRWDMSAFGWTYQPGWSGGEGPPPIIASWRGRCRRCGIHREETEYLTPQDVRQVVATQWRPR